MKSRSAPSKVSNSSGSGEQQCHSCVGSSCICKGTFATMSGQQVEDQVQVKVDTTSFDVDGEGHIIRTTGSGTEDYSSSPLNSNIISPGSGGSQPYVANSRSSGGNSNDDGAGGSGAPDPPEAAADVHVAATPMNQGIGGRNLNSNATSLSRETTDIGGHRVKETTTVSTMPDGTAIRTTETTPIDRNNKRAVRTTVHERTEPSGQTTRTTLTNHPDGSRTKQVETIRPGGSKSVMIETTDAKGKRNVETAEYPPTLVSTPEYYGMGSGQTVVSEITFARTQAPWTSPGTPAGYSNARPIDVDDMKELDFDDDDKPRPPPYWTTKRKLLLAGTTVLVAGVAAGAAVGIVLTGNQAETSSVPGAGTAENANDGDSGDGGDTGTPADDNENEGSNSNPFEDLFNSSLTPASVGFEHEWPSEEGWVVAPSVAETGKAYYRPYLISDLGLCADRCAKTDAVGGAFFPRTNGDGSLCYCFVAAECIEPLMAFPPGGTIFMSEPRPNEECDVSICWYFPDDPLCQGVEVIFDEPTSPPVSTRDTSPPTVSSTLSPTSDDTVDETLSPTANDGALPDDGGTEEIDDNTLAPTRSPTLAPSPKPSPSPTNSPTSEPTVSPTAKPSARPTLRPTTPEPTLQPTTPKPSNVPTAAPVDCQYSGPLERDIPCGDFRYTPWDEIKPTAQLLAELKLGYSENSWNNPGTASIESLSWNELNQDQRLGAGSVGFTEQTWDCYQNHYRGYSWDKLADEGVQQYYQSLGFDDLSWSGIGDQDLRDVAGNLSWNELNSGQRSALQELCYSKALWNGKLTL
mmetsp:Transcript_17597/g.38254  ORF Transcript_17597/g.38254 Transcript_17597/m.38254 type:complete len:803 (+) Transcript_17597:216-2624(+)